MDRLSALQIYVTVVDTGSFVGAARALNRSPPTITRVVAALERDLGVILLDRSSRRCQPTEVGKRFARDARRALSAYDETRAAASREANTPVGLVRLTAPLLFGRQHVAPIIFDLLDLHPGISIDLDLSDRPLDLVQEGMDLAVRIGAVSDRALVTRTIGHVRKVALASPAYLAGRGAPGNMAELAGHELIGHGAPRLPSTPATRLSTNNADAAIAAAMAGRGIVFALSYQVYAQERSGQLVRLFASDRQPVPVSLAWPEGRQRLRRVRVAIDMLAERLRAGPLA